MCAADLINPSRWRTMCLSGNSKCAAITATMSRRRKVMGTRGWLWLHHRPSTIFAMGPGYCNKYALSIVLCCSCTWRMCGVCYVLPLSMCTRCIVANVSVSPACMSPCVSGRGGVVVKHGPAAKSWSCCLFLPWYCDC